MNGDSGIEPTNMGGKNGDSRGNSSFSKLQDIAMENGPVDDLQMVYIYT